MPRPDKETGPRGIVQLADGHFWKLSFSTQSWQATLSLFQRRLTTQKNKGTGLHGSYWSHDYLLKYFQWFPLALEKPQGPETLTSLLSPAPPILALRSGYPGIPSAPGIFLTCSSNCLETFSHRLAYSSPSFISHCLQENLPLHTTLSEFRSNSYVTHSPGAPLLSFWTLMSITTTPPHLGVCLIQVCTREKATSVSAHYHTPLSCTVPGPWMDEGMNEWKNEWPQRV